MSYPPRQPDRLPAQSPSMLASHAERERAVDVLRAGFAEGRLDDEELEKRVARAHEARTVGELSLLVDDLPQGPVFSGPAPAGHYGPAVPATFLPAPQLRTNGKAKGALVFGILAPVTAVTAVTGVPAVVLGHMARKEIRRSDEQGDGLAVAGLVLGWASIIGWILLVAGFVTAVIVTR
ncbi:DUF1707 and DUF4190 domain-containing protein [Streptomyces sp. NPDC059970]|uniref:DUF1707 and DUF4190 domain-containing protein n=1 Tax=Streptomyces sp. NPDC059970 TaxID=3347019 RepID=UPI003679BD67